MSFGGGGGGSKAPAVQALPPLKVEPEAKKAKSDLLERLKRARSRALSIHTNTGLLAEKPQIQRKMLSDALG